MIISPTNEGICIRWREGEGDKPHRRQEVLSHNDFQPYFYVKKQDANKQSAFVSNKWSKKTSPFEFTYEHDCALNLDGESLSKVYYTPNHPKHMRDVKGTFNQTYEADVPYHHRYAVDRIQNIPEYRLRKYYWDMEWQQGGEHSGAITCIIAYDNYEEVFHQYAWFPEDNHYESKDILIFNNENEMLLSFLTRIVLDDPDMLISWFGNQFDLPKLLERCVKNGIDARIISPMLEITGFYESKDGYTFRKESFSPIEQPIKGRITLNLDLAFERQWNDSQRGTLPSMSLDYISTEVLNEQKLVSEKFPEKSEFFSRGWLEDTDTYLKYAKLDVDLIKRIDEENFTSEAIVSLQRLLKAPFDACFYASHMGGIYFMRNASWKAPTGRKEDRVDYDGAMVYDPLEAGTNGLHLGVAAFDFAGLYPSMMIARNISWETKSDTPTEFAVNIFTPKDFSDVDNTKMLYYNTDALGLLPRAVLELKELRNQYKKNMKQAESKSEYAKWNNNQLAVKRLMASFYGIIAYQGFGWADVDLAASITASAREAIREAAFKVRQLS